MRKNMIAIILAVIILLALIGVGAYALTPKYKTIEMSGLTLEVPDTNTSVQNNSVNYNTYNDQENNLTIKTWSDIDGSDINGSMQAGYDIGTQRGSNIGTNSTYDNVSVYNKSGTYTYYSENIEKQYMIVITGTDIEQVTHAAKSVNDTILPQTNNTNITIQNLTNETNNTDNNTTVSKDKSSVTHSTTNKKSKTDLDYDSERDDSHKGATEDNPVTVQQSDGEYTYYGPGHYDYYAGDNHMSGNYYKYKNHQ